MRIFRSHIKLTLLAVVLASTLFVVFGNTDTASAAPDYAYPDCCSGSTYISASQQGNGIYLNAPFSYLKLKFSGDTYYHIIDMLDACYWANVDGGSSRPGGCVGGHVTVTVCPSTPTGGFDIDYKNQGKCVNMDPASWGGGGQGLQSLWFRRAADPGGGTGLDIQTAPDGFKYMYLIVTMNTPGLNGFKVTSHARTSGGTNATYTRVGFGATQGANMPMSLVNLPLSGVGTSNFELKFRVPCQSSTTAFNLGWFDADRGASGIPQDNTIDFRLINASNGGQNFTAGQFAFISGQSLESYLGGNDASRSQFIGNSGIMRVQDTDLYVWRWENVRNNNGVQILLPYDEPDADAQCPPPSTDVCPNLAGNQATVPPGYVKDPVSGNCVIPPPPGPACPTFQPITRTVALPPSGIPPNTNAERHTYANRTEVNSVPDQWGQQATWSGGTNGSVDVDYTPFARDYPYDTHLVVVNYTVYYMTDHYENQPIVHTHNNPDYNGNGIADDGTYTESHDNWVYQYTSGPHATSQQQADAPDINPPCFNRTYDSTPEHDQVQLTIDQEEITSVNFSYRFTNDFSVTNSPANPNQVRERQSLALPYNVLWYIDRWDGPPGSVNTVAKTLNTTAPNNNAEVANHVANDNHSQSIYIAPGASNLRPGDRICFKVRITQKSTYPLATGGRGQMAVGGQIHAGSPRPAGEPLSNTTAETRETNDTGPSSEGGYSCSQIAVNRPYFRVYGGDAVAGSNFKTNGSCTATGGAGIFSWNRTSRPATAFYGNTPNGGAGAQLAAYATGLIQEFATAAGRGSAPTPMVGLAFANTSNPGGNWGTQYIGCMEDYYAGRTGTVVSSPSGYNGGTNGSFQGTGPFNFTGGTIPGGGVRRYTLYINGDLAITGNVNLASSTYNGIDQIPSIRLIATGNVYIAPNVTELNAIIISQGGTIFTCSDGGFNPPLLAQIVNPNYVPAVSRCRSKLTVNGALLATRVRFFRSIGSVRSSTAGEVSGSGNIAEVINYTPEVWLGTPSNVPANDKPYDSYTSLPPIL